MTSMIRIVLVILLLGVLLFVLQRMEVVRMVIASTCTSVMAAASITLSILIVWTQSSEATVMRVYT